MDIERLMAPAAWIWCDNSQEVNQYARFYQTFAAVPAETTLYICADSAYAVYINGQYVPGFACADYPECRSVDALSLAPYLHAGENRLCIVGYCPVSSSFCYRRGAPGAALCRIRRREPAGGKRNGNALLPPARLYRR